MEALKAGRPVLVYDADGREEETDAAIASQFVTPEIIRFLRKEAGGLICTTVPSEARQRLGPPYLAQILGGAPAPHPPLPHTLTTQAASDPIASPFSLTANHPETPTGIT